MIWGVIIQQAMFAQEIKSKIVPLRQRTSMNVSTLTRGPWNINLFSAPEHEMNIGRVREIKERNGALKEEENTPSGSFKTLTTPPEIKASFRSNDVKVWTPPDNTMAISRDGKIISATNQGMEFLDSSGNLLVPYLEWNDFLNDTSLLLAKFDPRVIYDPYHDRFIICVLHGPLDPDRSEIILAVSESSDPSQNWMIYTLAGNPFNDTSWADYPSIGLNEHELFINVNLFKTAAQEYAFNGTLVYQVGLKSIYSGQAPSSRLWYSITAHGKDGLTLNPAPHAYGNPIGTGMYFVQMMPDSASEILMYHITDTMNAPGVKMESDYFPIVPVTACANGHLKNKQTGEVDELSTGGCWIQNAFLLGDRIHFTFSGNREGWCGIHYGTVNLKTKEASYLSYSEPGFELAYPVVASLARDESEMTSVIGFLKAGMDLYPEFNFISLNDFQTWSSPKRIKEGETVIDAFGDPFVERWGDYTGICRRTGTSLPEIWTFGCYGTNTPPRNNSWSGWIAQLKTTETGELHGTDKVGLFPNPVYGEKYYLFLNLEQEAKVEIRLLSGDGRLIQPLFSGTLPATRSYLSFNKDPLATGAYFIEVCRNGVCNCEKMLIER